MTTTSATFPSPPPIASERNLSALQWGMAAFLVSEVAFFSTLIVAYVSFIGTDTSGPTPREALSLTLVIGTTICLLASSLTIHAAEAALNRGEQSKFCALWLATIALGVVFLLGTGYEWYQLIMHDGLTISRNLFGTTFYTLVGFHGLHVTAGVLAMTIIFGLAMRQQITKENSGGVQLIACYWHFVDVVWIVVFLIVYVGPKLAST